MSSRARYLLLAAVLLALAIGSLLILLASLSGHPPFVDFGEAILTISLSCGISLLILGLISLVGAIDPEKRE